MPSAAIASDHAVDHVTALEDIADLLAQITAGPG
jgi:hypothetical protein